MSNDLFPYTLAKYGVNICDNFLETRNSCSYIIFSRFASIGETVTKIQKFGKNKVERATETINIACMEWSRRRQSPYFYKAKGASKTVAEVFEVVLRNDSINKYPETDGWVSAKKKKWNRRLTVFCAPSPLPCSVSKAAALHCKCPLAGRLAAGCHKERRKKKDRQDTETTTSKLSEGGLSANRHSSPRNRV